MSRYLIAGLGNPGPKYAETRHNVGFMALDRLAERHRLDLSRDKFNGQFESGRIGSENVAALKPMTMMNRSGDSVGAAARYYGIEPGDIIVVHDDIDLSLGQVNAKKGGSTGGHNGLKDIANKIGSKDFVRVRIGIGRPDGPQDVTSYVLGRFSSEQLHSIDGALEKAATAVEQIVEKSLQSAQNRIN